ncbi:MmcQ/YjbR family DNA-binding protein [Cellulosilyticum sp. I15G10I2]|uniref:MmcQ/YjbR family DNA-binding protein n=1 Tax=Cellulosilyticum sp. I15G10I2 TaxID=1892843 RepID=UPI00085CCC14|nr:MmcQ/YjbR family DNA-binding protein [Cellulosilyticum sp. I15G10I2]
MDIKAYCLSLPMATLDYPFGETPMVIKVNNKMFALISNAGDVSLKCEPLQALAYRDMFEAVIPGYHLNKQHWNTIKPNLDIDDEMLKRMVRESYKAVVNTFPKKDRAYYLNLLF